MIIAPLKVCVAPSGVMHSEQQLLSEAEQEAEFQNLYGLFYGCSHANCTLANTATVGPRP